MPAAAPSSLDASVLVQLKRFPATRFQGSKAKLLPWILESLADLPFETVLDAFSGTGAVSYAFKCLGKQVTSNDILKCNTWIAQALIENPDVQLSESQLTSLLAEVPIDPKAPPGWIAETFAGIYYTDAENHWLDAMVARLAEMPGDASQALAYFALFQACLAKRPYNLFHRRNLYLRFAEVSRSFGNKVTWDRPFPVHFEKFARQANAAVFDSGQSHRVCHGDALAVPGDYDLVYLDPPYLSAAGVGVDYAGFYHFLEGLSDRPRWPERVDATSPHRRMHREPSPWMDRRAIHEAFQAVFERFAESILVVSYRADGIPSLPELTALLQCVKPQVTLHHRQPYQYALSTRRTEEILLIGQ